MTVKIPSLRSTVTHFDAVAYFDARSNRYDRDAFAGAGLERVSELELAAIDNALGGAHGAKVLDIGSGTGRVVRRLLANGAVVTGMDGAANMVERVRTAHPEVDMHQGLLGDTLPFPDASFDAVVSLRVIKYLSDWSVALSEISRVLVEGGIVVLEIANHRSLARFGYPGQDVRTVSLAQARKELAAANLMTFDVAAGTRLPHAAWNWASSSTKATALAAAESVVGKAAPLAAARSYVLTAAKVAV